MIRTISCGTIARLMGVNGLFMIIRIAVCPRRKMVAVRQPTSYPVSDLAILHAWMRAQKKKRKSHSSSVRQASRSLSQLLRTLGDHLDRSEVHFFQILWMPHAITVNYQGDEAPPQSRTFTPEELQQLSLHTRFRRSHPPILRLNI
jgi:hypothetical protein